MDIDGEVQANLSLLGNASSHFSVEHRQAVIKHLNKDLRPLADADFPNRGPQFFGDDFGKRENNVSALKGLQVKKSYISFSGSGDFKISPSPRSCRAVWGVTPASANRKSVFGRLDTAPKSLTFLRLNKHQHQKDQNNRAVPTSRCPSSNRLFRPVCRSNSLVPTSLERNYFRLLSPGSSQGVHVGVETETSTSDHSRIGGATELVISGVIDALLNKGAVYEVSTDKGFYSRNL